MIAVAHAKMDIQEQIAKLSYLVLMDQMINLV